MIQLNEHIISNDRFPDGTLLMKLPFSPKPSNEIRWHYENDAELFKLICLVKTMREMYKDVRIDLFMPYLPNARQDRVKNPEDVFTLKYFCEVINSLEFDTVFVTDVHSNVGLALLDRVREIKPWGQIHNALTKITFMETGDVMHEAREECYKNLLLFYPDEGAMKRYSGEMGMPYIFGVKDRDWKTGQIKRLNLAGDVSMIEGKNILIIDDICSKGGTFYYAAKELKEAGAANIYLYVTHCENTIYEGELLKEDSLIKHIFTTTSLLTAPNEKMTIVE
jgi:ribose-phosphate pyrophosphokinase